MAKRVTLPSDGIKKILKNYTPKASIAEYIWNGFDAKADTIEISYDADELGNILEFQIKDNGYGIDFSKLKEKFEPFFDSKKAIEISNNKHTSVIHGKNGVGRLTFYTFAGIAKWNTVFNSEKGLKNSIIKVAAEALHEFIPIEVTSQNLKSTGTTVSFHNLLINSHQFESEIIEFLAKEFCWFLELNKNKGYTITINDKPLQYENLKKDYEKGTIETRKSLFNYEYVQWEKPLNKEFSKFYFIDNKDEEIYKDYTTFNKKGDNFHHSIYIRSSFFDNFDFKSQDASQTNLFNKAKSSAEYKELIEELNEIIKSKRKPFLKEYADKLIDEYEEEGIFPEYRNSWEQYRKIELIDTIKGLYEAQPKLFNKLNKEQKKTFVRFLDLLLDSNERENIFRILDEVVDLGTDERQELANLFRTTKLSRITSTIKLIEDRYSTYYALREMVFNKDLNANEVKHLQTLVENHYWFFGEQYHLVTAAEPKFEEALKRYQYYLTEKDISTEIDHPDKLKEMDIFACRQNFNTDSIQNIVVELKHPLIKLGREQAIQVDKYLDVIIKQTEFNGNNTSWEFYLIGCDFDSSGYIERQIESNRNHGEKSLILNIDSGRVKVYAKKWSEIFNEFEIKHKHIDEKLKLEKLELISKHKSADAVLDSVASNSANQPKEVELP